MLYAEKTLQHIKMTKCNPTNYFMVDKVQPHLVSHGGESVVIYLGHLSVVLTLGESLGDWLVLSYYIYIYSIHKLHKIQYMLYSHSQQQKGGI